VRIRTGPHASPGAGLAGPPRGRAARDHLDLARLRALAHRDRHRQDAVLVGRGDPLRVDALAQAQLAQERPASTLLGQPLRALRAAAQGALGADRQQLPVDVDVDGAGVDARQVRGEHVVVAVAVQVHRHQLGSLPRVEEGRGHAVQLAERVEVHRHGVRPSVLRFES
jgi:hypothetical protein